MMYCVVPSRLGRKLHGTLERHFRDDDTVTVIVDQRGGDRRREGDRRNVPLAAWTIDPAEPIERRRIRNTGGRRVDERRADMVAALDVRALPRAARRHEEAIQFAVRIELPARRLEDAESARLATRAQTGDRDAFRELYARYFDAVYSYLRLALQSVHDVEDGLQAVFAQTLGSLSQHCIDSMPFPVWLGTMLYGHAPDRSDPVSRAIDEAAPAASAEEALELLEWLTDDDLRMLMERLPALEREVMGLCYILDLTAREIGAITGLSIDEVERAHVRSIRFMSRCLASLGRRPGYSGRHPITAAPRPEIVMRRRRLALARG
jgi:RNA polymerase sigma factor (sigma-70 family)